jgi:hypothetical protein
MEVDFQAGRILKESVIFKQLSNDPGGLRFMKFDLAVETPYLVLKLAAGPLEGVIQCEIEVGMTFIGVRCTGRVDFLSGRQSEPDIDLIETSCVMVTAGPDSDDTTGADTPKSFFKEFDMLLHRRLLVVIWCKALEINFYWCVHNFLLKLDLI